MSSRSSAFPPRPDGPARTELVMSERIDSSISTFSEQPGQSPTWAITSSRTSCTFECSLGEVFDEFVSNVRTRDLPICYREGKVQKFTRTPAMGTNNFTPFPDQIFQSGTFPTIPG